LSPTYCVRCGAEMQESHKYCARCGAERLTRPGEDLLRPALSSRVRWLPYLFAAGAVFWLIELTQFAAVVAAPAGRDQLIQALVNAGIKKDVTTILILECAIVFSFEAGAAVLHGFAYYGLKKLRAWGWVTAVIAAGAWSLVLIGIPVLVFLFQRPTRQAYGIS
jgi:hypothetical protein